MPSVLFQASNRSLMVTFTVLLVFIVTQGLIAYYPALYKIVSSPTGNETETVSTQICLRNEFSNVVLVIVFNHPHYSNIPHLSALYKNAFPTIMFCGSENSTGELTVEALNIHKGYFGYICMSHAIQKHPGYSGYLLTSDDLILNYWTLVGLNRDQIWEGPLGELQFRKVHRRHGEWAWWRTPWGRGACQNSLNEIKTFSESNSDEKRSPEMLDNQLHPQSMVWNINKAIDIYKKNHNSELSCSVRHADAFYIPGRFAAAYTKLSDIFYKHKTFLEIAVPTIFRMIDFQENFELMNGIYLAREGTEETMTLHLWEVYNKTLAFVHPFKLNSTMNTLLLRKWIIEYSDSLTNCEKD